MRKFLLIAMVMFTLPMFAQNYNLRLASIYSEDGYELWDYIYASPSNTHLVCINEADFTTSMECIDSIFYDANGNIINLSTWQKLDNEWKNPCYIEYEYNDKNLRISRKNYNYFNEWTLGGIYRYEYNEEGQMIGWSLEFGGNEEFQKATIEYNEEGYKTVEIIQQFNKETYYLENAYMTEFNYDINNNMIRSNEFFWDNGIWSMQASRINEYDEYGNCILAEQTTATGTVQEKKVFAYDVALSGENVFYYPNPEDDYPQLPEAKKNLLKSFEYYAMNDSQELGLVTTYFLGYEAVEGASVEEVAFASSVYPNPAQDYVMVESSEANYVEVVDVYGRVVFATEMSETVKVDMSEFASGIYFVKLQANGATSVQKIMKK